MSNYAAYADTNKIYGIDSTYIYDADLNKDWFYLQKDVYCFKNVSETKHVGALGGIVDAVVYWDEMSMTKFNEIHFNPSSTIFQRALQVEAIHNMSNYRISALALTSSPTADYTQNKFYRTDDLIMVTFNDPTINAATVTNFMSRYNLQLVHAPSNSLNNTVSWAYVFKVRPTNNFEVLTITLAQYLVETETTLIKHAEPNLYATESLACLPTTEVGLNPAGIDGTWHIRNEGNLVWSGLDGTADADADICDCWGEGYTGEGIKVAVIDFGGIEFSHDDFEGTNINEVFAPSTGTVYTSDYTLEDNGHAIQVTGIIAATPNNSGLGYRYAVGAAYDATVRPALIQSFTEGSAASNVQIAIAIQNAVDEKQDIVNMSFRTFAGTGSIEAQINNGVAIGRPDGSGGFNGIIFVAAVGNNNVAGSNFPANLDNVIGVGWSNPEDYRSAYDAPGLGGGWATNPGEGSTYGGPGNNYDVVAPGELIMTTNLSTAGSSYIFAKGSSMSAPIVSSIAAILLEKSPKLTYNEVKQAIRNGAEKVNTSTYNYSSYGAFPGYNDEMFYGRVSCINSLNDELLSVSEEKQIINLTVLRESENQYTIMIPASIDARNFTLHDMTGRIISSERILSGTNQVRIDLANYANGLYIFNIYNTEGKLGVAKIVK